MTQHIFWIILALASIPLFCVVEYAVSKAIDGLLAIRAAWRRGYMRGQRQVRIARELRMRAGRIEA